MENKPKISCVMTTYGRFTCVERSIKMFQVQDYDGPTELIILNTAVNHPIYFDKGFKPENITIINNNIDYLTKEPYTNVGAIRRDALTHATGDYYICWDDDDIFLPWNIRQCVDGLNRTGKKAWKPRRSFFKTQDRLVQVQNTLEASVIVSMESVREFGFILKSGYEHLEWYTRLRDLGELNELDDEYVPGYCFNWSDSAEIAGHKQSGDINNPENFENHKRASTDFAFRGLIDYLPINDVYRPYISYFKNNKEEFHQEAYEKYVQSYLA